ncbi:MAG TPA: hypothetical protein VJ599_06870 [Nitrososphaeraceae archaeon]|jgi:hypothetical protein|nr:hypothetical protein [Nitrososphaeraceae archaeon]
MVEQQKIDIAEESTTKSTIEKKQTSSSTKEKGEKEQDNAAGIEAEELTK